MAMNPQEHMTLRQKPVNYTLCSFMV
uniref:Uncharacterized protein n=1 Tax=Arundo donax TaxID=35708 RepID=A0A0A9C5A6_ARUDO